MYSAIQDAAAHAKIARKINALGQALMETKTSSKVIQESLGTPILGMRRALFQLENTVRTMEIGGINRRTAGLFTGLAPSTTGAPPSIDSLVAEVVAAIGLTSYVKIRDIPDLFSPYNLGKIVRELKGGELT